MKSLVINVESKDLIAKTKDYPKIKGPFFHLKNGLNPGNVKHILIVKQKKNNRHRPIVRGKDISRYGLRWSGEYINYDKSLASSITVDDVRTKKGMNKQDHVDFALRSPEIFECKKLLIRKTGDRLICTYDESYNYYFDTLAHGIYLKDSTYSLQYLMAILNSRFATYLYRLLHDIKGKIFAKINLDSLSNFPIAPCNPEQQQPFIEKANTMLVKNKEFFELSSKFHTLLKSECGLEKLSPKLEQWYILDFAEFVNELKKKKISLSLEEKAEWMDYFREQKRMATKLKTIIDSTDHEIDQMVYALYNLTPEEIAIVESAF